MFRAVAPTGTETGAETARNRLESSPIGLESESKEAEAAPLDADEVERLEAAANDDPDDAEVRARLGRLYMDAGRYEDAVAWQRSAVEIDPDNLEVRTQLALSLLNLGRLEDAVAAYEDNLRLEPEHPASLLGLGRIKLYLQQDIQGGLAMWERLVTVAPGSAEAESVRDELEALKSAHSGS